MRVARRRAARAGPWLVLMIAMLCSAPAAQAQCGSGREGVGFCGGPVMHTQRLHAIFWLPSGSGLAFDPGYEQQISLFLQRVAAASGSTDNVFGLMGQYRDATGPAAYDATVAGAINDADPLPHGAGDTCQEPSPPPVGVGPGWSACVSDAGIEAELDHLARVDRLPVGVGNVYFLLTPSGLGSCFASGPSDCALGGKPNNGYCGYHGSTGSVSTMVYAVIPYNAVAGHCQSTNPRPNDSPADPTISTIAHEYAESATDPYGSAWLDSRGMEIADLCLTDFGPALGGSGDGRYNEVIDGGHYWIQELWSNVTRACEPRALPDPVAISAQRRARAGRVVRFLARASDPEGAIAADAWSFGDGRRGRGKRTEHTFRRPGRYTVTLRITDTWGNRVSAPRAITIVPR